MMILSQIQCHYILSIYSFLSILGSLIGKTPKPIAFEEYKVETPKTLIHTRLSLGKHYGSYNPPKALSQYWYLRAH
jgi:hypothetical protein